VVGVDGSPEAMEAFRYAAELAIERRHDLLVAHAYHLPAAPPISADFIAVMQAGGQEVLDQVLSDLAAPSSLRVETVLDMNGPVLMLHQLAALAEIVVVGHHHVNLQERLLLGSVAAPLAAKAPCPVVVVRKGWSASSPTAGSVVVALDGETAASAALDYAFTQAEFGRTDLLALHVAPLNELPTDRAGEERSIEEILSGWKQDHPDTPVSTKLVPGDPQDVIVDASYQAAVLIVGRPHTGRFGSWTRSVARSVMNRSICPLVVVPPRSSDVERASEVLRTGVPT
jgi:nucleotide-binding universal stress UspA family protein